MIRSLLARLRADEDLEALLLEIDAAIPRRETRSMDQLFASMVENDFDLDEGWADIEAALVAGEITEQQYARIREYVLGD